MIATFLQFSSNLPMCTVGSTLNGNEVAVLPSKRWFHRELLKVRGPGPLTVWDTIVHDMFQVKLTLLWRVQRTSVGG
jgi:hypothetical protein